MTPVTFNGLFGFVHEAPGDCAVIMCGAVGYEQLCASRSWRELAENIAARGYPVLRFDWSGCGDSLGDDRDPARLSAWRESLTHATTYVRINFSPRRIVLIGLRFGATLATQHATEAGGVDGLALLGPAINGRIYGRELAALAGVVGKPADTKAAPALPTDGIEVAGFAITSETLKAMKSIDLRQLARMPAAHVLLVTPPGQSGAHEVAVQLESLGSSVERVDFEGYAELLAEPTYSRTPHTVFDQLMEWLAATFPFVAKGAIDVSTQHSQLQGDGFSETPVLFGETRKLFGMFCQPRETSSESVVIFVNAGANPHIGWARMNVEFARCLARSGCASLRIDVAGLGDSPPAPGRDPQIMYDTAPQSDVSAAIDWLQSQGMQKFTVVGLCSGAHLAFHSAVADARINGVVMANLQRFVWRKDYSLAIALRRGYRSTDFYKGKMMRRDTWKRVLRGQIDVLGIAAELVRRVHRVAKARIQSVMRGAKKSDDDTAKVRRWFETLGNRNTRVLLVYSAEDCGVDEIALHMGPQGKFLKRIQGMEITLIEAADHNFTPRWARERLLQLLADFLDPKIKPTS